jgi:hypothetical protein
MLAGENSCNSGDGKGPNGPTPDVYDDDDDDYDDEKRHFPLERES